MKPLDYVQIKVAAQILGVTPNTLRNWDRQGKLKSRRHPINGYRMYKKSELEALIASVAESVEPKEQV